MKQLQIAKVWVDATHVYAQTTDGLVSGYPFTQWKRLAAATEAQRRDFYLSYSGIHWPQIDEDLNFESMFSEAGLCDTTLCEDSVVYNG